MRKKIIAVLTVSVLLLSLSSCGIISPATENFTDPPEETTLATQAPTPQKAPLTVSSLIAHVNRMAAATDVPSAFVSGFDKKPSENGGITTSFTYYGDLVSASVTEENDIVQTIMLAALPAKFAEAYSADSGLAYAYVACLQLLECCEADKDTDWHNAQRESAPEEGDQSTSIRTYTTDEWMYVAIVNEYFITLTAARYCKQCGGNAPTVTFTADSPLCQNCFNSSGSTSTLPNQNLSLSQVLDLSKVWMFEFSAGGIDGVFHYAFDNDGTCYVVLSDGLEPWAGGKGTYQFNGNTLDFSIVMDGSRLEYGYSYNPQTKILTQIHGTPLFAGLTGFRGQHQFVEDDANDVAKIRDMATDFAGSESSSASGNGGFSNNNGSSGNGNSTNHTPTPGGNTSSGSSNPGAGTQTVCEHSYNEATCTKPKTCTKCGATTGSTIDHTWKYTSCTTEKACSVCNAPLIGSTPGHQWKNATCTNPETCGVCNETQGQALGHDVRLTKCIRCSYTDYSAIAKSYSVSSAYDSKTGEDLTVTDVSVNKSGVLSFTFNGTRYSITIKEKTYDSMTYFTCYQDGKKLSNAECRIGDASYYNMLHFEWDGIDGHRLYFCTKKQ